MQSDQRLPIKAFEVPRFVESTSSADAVTVRQFCDDVPAGGPY
jgi:hypothetical protein